MLTKIIYYSKLLNNIPKQKLPSLERHFQAQTYQFEWNGLWAKNDLL